MRTKNFNLKKKIAFIASVAMIATTAAYLPAGSLTASASTAIASGNYTTDTAVTATPVAGAINNFEALVKINNKYLSKNGNGEYSLQTKAALTSTGNEWTAVTTAIPTQTTTKNPYGDDLDDTDPGYAALSKAYDLMDITAGGVIEIPYVADATEIELEFVAKKGAVMSTRSLESVSFDLNEYGVGRLGKMNEYVVSKSDKSNYDETKDEFDGAADGSYEVVDLSNLAVVMQGTNKSDNTNIKNSFDTANIIKKNDTALGAAIAMGFKANNAPAVLDEEEIYPDTYEVVKSGGVYARVIEKTLTADANPDDVFVIDTGVNGNWTASGNRVSKGEVTVSMDKDGYAVSDLVTMTKNNTNEKEYYIYVIKNKATALNNGGTADFGQNLKFNGANATGNEVLDEGAGADTDVKIKKSLVIDKVGANKKYITKYTVYNNQTTDQWKANADAKKVEFTLTGGTNTNQFLLANTDQVSSGKTTLSASAGTGTVYDKITLEMPSAGTVTSEIIAWVDNSGANPVVKDYFMVEFTNKYDIEYDDEWDDNNEDPTKNYDGKVSVSGTKVTNPGTVSRPGFKFKGWHTALPATEGNAVFTTDNGKDQIDNNNINPNVKLHAAYEGLRYDVSLDANGGYFNAAAGGSLNTYKAYPGFNSTKPTKATYANQERNAAVTEVNTWKINTVSNTGYTFKGWSTNKDATKGMTVSELEAAFPGEGKTLTLYAVWEANDITFAFKRVDLDAEGAAKELDGKKSATVAAWHASAQINADFEKAADKSKTQTMGAKVGTLPTPYLKGYDFEGWYACVMNSNLTETTAVKVTEDTDLTAELMTAQAANATTLSGAGSNTTITLYAKFTQKKFNITFDIGSGLWANSEIDDEDGSLPATVAYNPSAGTADAKFTFRRPDGEIIPYGTWTTVDNPKVGNDGYTTFDGWVINDGRTTYADLEAVYAAIKKMDSLEDLVIKATYETDDDKTQASIFLNANEGDFYRYNVANKAANANKKPVAFVAANGDVVGTNGKTPADVMVPGQSLGDASAGTKVSDKWLIKDTYVEPTSGTYGFQVARPGYTFTGWYTDKECTQKYTIDKYPEKGTELVLYAGWKADTTVIYKLVYDLYEGDKSIKATNRFKLYTTTMGATANAEDLVVKVKDGEGTQSTYTEYVFDKVLSAGLDDTSKEVKASFAVGGVDQEGLKDGKFVQDPNTYTTIYGKYIEKGFETPDQPPVSTELGKATDVKGTANGDKVTISFKAADNAVKYQVCKIVNGKKYYTAKTDKTSIDITPASVDYQVYVIAFDETGKKSTHSETIKLTGVKKYNLGTVMDPKVTETVEGDKKTATVTWSKVEGATWYKVFKMVGGKKFWGKKVTDPSYVLKDIPKADSYIIYVAAGDDKGHVTYGARKKITKYPAVTNVKLADDKKTVTFNKAEGAVSYQVAKVYADNTVKYSKKSSSNTIVLGNAAKAGQKLYVLAFFTGEDGKTYSSYSDSIEVK